MFKIPYNEIISTLQEKTELSAQELEGKVQEKMEQLSGLVSKEGAAHIVANELGIKLLEPVSGKLQIKNIVAGMRDLETAGKILQVYDVREFVSNGREGKVGSFIVGDETATIRVVCWGDQANNLAKLNQGDIVSFQGAYVKDNKGRKELHLNERSTLLINPEGVEVGEVSYQQQTQEHIRKAIKDLTEQDSAVEILGTIVQAFEPRFFERKNTATPQTSYVINAVVDDGTETIRTAFFAEQAAALLNKKHEEMLAYQQDPTSFEPHKHELLGTIAKISGRVKKNEMFDRHELIARSVVIDPNPTEELQRLQS